MWRRRVARSACRELFPRALLSRTLTAFAVVMISLSSLRSSRLAVKNLNILCKYRSIRGVEENTVPFHVTDCCDGVVLSLLLSRRRRRVGNVIFCPLRQYEIASNICFTLFSI